MPKEIIYLKLLTFVWVTLCLVYKFVIPLDRESKRSSGYYIDALLNFTELTEQYGYSADVHDVTTEDGYILTLFHITKSKNCRGPVKKPPVLLMHGLIESADLFLDAGPKSGLGYLIPDHCYDLWVGNQRGNYYGRRHTHLNPDKDATFWEFTAEEMSYYDIPGIIDYILNYTNTDKVNYIGYSQGGSNFFIMCSERREYCKKTQLMIALGPSVFLGSMNSIALRIITKTALVTRPILEMFDINEVLYKGSVLQQILEYFCQHTDTFITDVLCGTAGIYVDNYHAGSISYDTQKTLFGHFPAGTSVKNLARYSQIIASGKFRKYDYGQAINMKIYGSKEPPDYNLSAVTVPVVIIHGRNDKLTVIEDIKRLEDELPNVVDSVIVSDPSWTHLDIVYSQYSQEIVFPTLNKYLNEYIHEGTTRCHKKQLNGT